MKFTVETKRTDRYEFVVCGGGPAGFATALAAARKGLKVALVEKTGCLGGVSTNAGIHFFLGGRKLDASKNHARVIGGIFDEFTDNLIRDGKAIEPNSINLDFNPFGWYPRMASGISCDENAIKIGMETLLLNENVRIYFYSDIVGASENDGNVEQVFIHNKDGFIALSAPLYADCTGDGDVAASLGCEFSKGRREDGLTTPASLEMVLDCVDGDKLVSYQNEHQSPKLIEIINNLKQEGKWPFPFDIFVGMQLVEKDVFLINTIRQIKIDGTNEASVSEALINGRTQNLQLFNIMQQYFPGFEHARIRRIYDWMGIRESRRFAGEETVTTEGALSGHKFDDCIAATTYNFDLPDPLKPSYDPMMKSVSNPNATRKHIVIEIPYRSLLPKKVHNLILAGRCISCEREVLGPIRIMGPCMQMGQAAGTAASFALKTGNFKTIDIQELQNTLWQDKVINPKELPFG